jgi:membrane protein YdbS with pleckstrin-like domain
MNRKTFIGVAVGIFGLIVFLFIWPTIYRYDVLRHERKRGPIEDKTEQLIRTNRFTGTTQILSDHGWVTTGPS